MRYIRSFERFERFEKYDFNYDLIPLGEVMLRMDILVMVELEPQDPSRFVKVVVSIML